MFQINNPTKFKEIGSDRKKRQKVFIFIQSLKPAFHPLIAQ